MGIGRTHHAGYGNGQSCCGKHEEQPENVIGDVEVGHALRVNEVGQGDGEKQPQQFDDQRGCGKNGRTLYKALFLVLRHKHSL